ncbi:hypothetical protein C8R47DRAFT_1204832 [Mycena vitilis]|nr:hypothetical protein C8R47DRAFT_1204832 [Mycena vitilis]
MYGQRGHYGTSKYSRESLAAGRGPGASNIRKYRNSAADIVPTCDSPTEYSGAASGAGGAMWIRDGPLEVSGDVGNWASMVDNGVECARKGGKEGGNDAITLLTDHHVADHCGSGAAQYADGIDGGISNSSGRGCEKPVWADMVQLGQTGAQQINFPK